MKGYQEIPLSNDSKPVTCPFNSVSAWLSSTAKVNLLIFLFSTDWYLERWICHYKQTRCRDVNQQNCTLYYSSIIKTGSLYIYNYYIGQLGILNIFCFTENATVDFNGVRFSILADLFVQLKVPCGGSISSINHTKGWEILPFWWHCPFRLGTPTHKTIYEVVYSYAYYRLL